MYLFVFAVFSVLKLHHVQIVEWHMVSISTKYKHLTSLANFCAVSISSSRLNTPDNTKMRWFSSSWHLWRTCWNVSISKVLSSMRNLTKLSLSHLSIIGIKTFISIFNDKSILHLDACWTNKSRFLFFWLFLLWWTNLWFGLQWFFIWREISTWVHTLSVLSFHWGWHWSSLDSRRIVFSWLMGGGETNVIFIFKNSLISY